MQMDFRFNGTALQNSPQAFKCIKVGEHKEKPHSLLRNCGVYLVAWDGIEPSTRGFSIRCSTN